MPDEPAAKPRIYTSAFLCQDVIREKNNDILTAVRITNAYTVLPTEVTVEIGPGITITKQEYLPTALSAVLSFYSDGPVDFEVRLSGHDPDGVELTFGSPFHCRSEGGAAGHTLNTRIIVATKKPGEHRIDVYVDEVRVTTMPLRIIHAHIQTGNHQPGQPPQPPAAASD
jgi:hypothetical protein